MTASSGAAGTRGAGTDDRLWVDGPRPASIDDARYEITERQAGIPMRDGITLSALVIEPVLPVDGPPPPSIVVTNGYSGIDVMFLPYLRGLATRGYPVVLARLRGVAPSEGQAGFYENFGPDGHDVIEWTAKQPFTNGKVGMVGASLLGISQWLAAKDIPSTWSSWRLTTPPAIPIDICGTPAAWNRVRAGSAAMRFPAWSRNTRWRSRTLGSTTSGGKGRRPGRTSRIWLAAAFRALLSTGWDSYMVDSASRPFTWMRAAGAGSRVKLLIGPWRHGAMFSGGSFGGEPAPGEMVLPYWGFDLQLMWLDRWLRDVDNGIDEEPPVLIYVQGPNEWRYEQDWPLPDEKRISSFLLPLRPAR